MRRFGFNRGHTFLVDHWLSLSGGRSPCYVSFNALQRRCHFAKPWCSLRSVVGSISRETRWQASNLCQPSISMKVDILQIFTLFHPACESCPDGVCYIICLFRVHIWDGSKSHLVQLKRKATQTGEMQEGGCYIIRQTSCIARQAMHKSGYASPKIQVNANNKHTSGTEMDFAYHKMNKIASNGIFSWKQGNVVGLQVLFCAHTLVTSY